MIQNDLLGLTIHQFESRFEECLERRTRNKEWLLNIRFPDKTSDGYIEYLENCQEDESIGLLPTEANRLYLSHYNAALKIVEYVLSRCSTNLLVLSCPSFKQSDIKQYQSISECEVLTLTEKMKLSTSKYVQYYKKSSLIPHEFKLDNQDNNLNVSCDVMSSCIKFLCYHHLNEIENKEQSLSDLRFIRIWKSHGREKS
ncbi:unnamed protein product [Mytilus edulis]|uniref:Uncharacterized protein n=1 Tax=Mytilus edulis TaxID=6550 RepID=A0A8S3SL22_MYTED|nr:unnamed protein product [Mytilus edulis]